MSPIFRSLIITSLLTANLTHPICWVSLDYKAYDEYTRLACQELKETASQVQTFDKENASLLRDQQKTALKTLLEDINKKGDDKLSHQFKWEVYGQWKREFDHRYEKSLTNNDWTWLNKPISISIQE